MRCHAMIGHGAPGMVLWCRLREPYITSIACKLTCFQCSSHCITVTNFTTCCIHNVAAAFHLGNHGLVEQVFGFWVQWAVDCDNIHYLDHALYTVVPGQIQFLFHMFGQAMTIIIVQMYIKWFQQS